MIIAFYKVNNSLGYERHEFDAIEDKEILEKLNQLPDEEVKFYDTNHYGYGAVPSPNMADFEEDYNDEELDGGWWCIVLNIEEEELPNTFFDGKLAVQFKYDGKTYKEVINPTITTPDPDLDDAWNYRLEAPENVSFVLVGKYADGGRLSTTDALYVEAYNYYDCTEETIDDIDIV